MSDPCLTHMQLLLFAMKSKMESVDRTGVTLTAIGRVSARQNGAPDQCQQAIPVVNYLAEQGYGNILLAVRHLPTHIVPQQNIKRAQQWPTATNYSDGLRLDLPICNRHAS